ncbi:MULTISPECIES: DUF6646 family protein [Flavobacterium]|uniref:Outer membrane protein beta-barrel domain-containing protein n=1 Tax=Flavobacterium gawalongense TaxID=2594432 RepID=A0A553BTK8_9FLAO|nr:DUF6646 family protein [Flavobacterium gawalongense]TRX02183.1 hypothetical protein FNW33_06830 [Flavobacterium gawalongense]TRX07412.1 hypothetical protein FNW12_06135 [Flavobacterium gawalongense]TRX11580.1 hypothetical protein FNW11_05160 [Flavobacterium gawalongense]TRX12417.1 hypothetical protein FNW10_04730 [Flavobacterium gawalongense]TRX30317.1 hypothetical protein FNW38_04425 [Flavobacterium gawalongense]
MKKIITLALLLSFSLINAQAFKGKGDAKFNVGANIQNGGTGIQVSTDFGIGENLSYGFVGSYLLGVKEVLGEKPEFKDRFDAKFRINANLGNVLKVDEKLDFYPGLNLGLKNFGGHVGMRYFFSEGFGIYSEAGFPIAKYDSNSEVFNHLNNQFTFNIGASFNM